MPVVLLLDGATRPGFSPWHHGASQLGTDDRGWLQTANFVLGGVLFLGFATGVRAALRRGRGTGRGAIWAPVLLAVSGLALIVAGIVPTDPALGYPPGEPTIVTTAGRIHGLAGLLLFAGLAATPLVLARRLDELTDPSGSSGPDRRWRHWSRTCGILVLVLAIAAGTAFRLDLEGTLSPAPAGALEQAALLIGFAWTVAASLHLYRHTPADQPAWSRR
ncbi:hypothetical protein JOD67_003227 [Tenggerimyces flavus]|nr:hypothetical protein [Tenggerimyces flavus]